MSFYSRRSIKPPQVLVVLKYSPDQPRDENGQWTDSGAAKRTANAINMDVPRDPVKDRHLYTDAAHRRRFPEYYQKGRPGVTAQNPLGEWRVSPAARQALIDAYEKPKSPADFHRLSYKGDKLVKGFKKLFA